MASGFDQSSRYNPHGIHPYDYANWGYTILYLVVIVGGLVGNGLFAYVVIKNRDLHRSAHFLLASLAIRDVVVAVSVVPFVIDSQAVNMMQWNAGGVMCKLYTFLNYSTMATHSFILVFLSLFLYFWYKKQDAFTAEENQTVGRKNRFHKWAIPLTWVLGLGLAIPAGALAIEGFDMTTNTRTCTIWHGRDGTGSNFYVQLSMVIVGFFVPLLILFFPVVALAMQLLGSREPRLQPPHSRTGWTVVLLFFVFIGTRGPAEIYMLMKLFQGSPVGFRQDYRWNSAYATGAFETDVTINCLIYVAILIHPFIYFGLNPDYRTGVRQAWRNLACNKDPATRAREEEERRQRKVRQYPAGAKRNRVPTQIRRGQEQLLQQPQPQIMGAGQAGVQYYPYPQQMQGMTQQQQMQFAQQQQQLIPNQQFLDTSFERLSPQLPPVFEFEGLKYIDTARVEPRIGYSPEKTPQKTPEIPRYQNKPFAVPGMPPPQGVMGHVSPSSPVGDIEMVDMSPQARAASAGGNFEVEHLDSSPGSTLRSRSRNANRDDLDESIDILTESPGNKNRRRNVTRESQETSSPSTNGNGLLHNSRPTSPSGGGDPGLHRPSSRSSGVVIEITGRTRSRTDLCPDVPRSKFEHSV